MDIAAEANRIRSVDLDAPYSAVTVSLDAGSTTFETYADLHEGLDLAKDNEAAFFGAGGAGDGYADSAAIGAEASRVEGLGADFDGLEAAVVTAQGDVDTFFGAGGAGEGYADSAAIGAEASRVEGLGADFDGLEAAVVTAQGDVDTFFGAGGAFC